MLCFYVQLQQFRPAAYELQFSVWNIHAFALMCTDCNLRTVFVYFGLCGPSCFEISS